MIPTSSSSDKISPSSDDIPSQLNDSHFKKFPGQTSSDHSETLIEHSPSIVHSTEFFLSGVKRPFSRISPPLFSVESLFTKKSTRDPKIRLRAPQKLNINFSDTSVDFNSISDNMAAQPQTLKDIQDRLDRLEEAYSEIFRLQKALADSEAARHELEKQVALLSSSSSSTTPPAPPKVVVQDKSASPSPHASSKSYASAASKAVNSDKNGKLKKKKEKLPSPRSAATAITRLFGPSAGKVSEYQYVYYKSSSRRPLRELRRLFTSLDINASRVLDIHYPVANVVAFLLHADYILQFTSAMHMNGKGSSPLVDFDPYDPQNLKDPKFASLGADLRLQKAREVENLRCLRSLSFVRRSVRVSVARSFLRYEKINRAQFDAILAEELAARAAATPLSPASPSRSSVVEQQGRKQHLRYLGFLLHHDATTAKLLADAPSRPSSPVDEHAMEEL